MFDTRGLIVRIVCMLAYVVGGYLPNKSTLTLLKKFFQIAR